MKEMEEIKLGIPRRGESVIGLTTAVNDFTQQTIHKLESEITTLKEDRWPDELLNLEEADKLMDYVEGAIGLKGMGDAIIGSINFAEWRLASDNDSFKISIKIGENPLVLDYVTPGSALRRDNDKEENLEIYANYDNHEEWPELDESLVNLKKAIVLGENRIYFVGKIAKDNTWKEDDFDWDLSESFGVMIFLGDDGNYYWERNDKNIENILKAEWIVTNRKTMLNVGGKDSKYGGIISSEDAREIKRKAYVEFFRGLTKVNG